jgi:microcystin-dependent protein
MTLSSIYDWSTTAANNATADADLTWAEGQPPSTVNNSARQMMKRNKELLIDLGGSVVAGGSANALTVSASSAFSTLADGRIVSFRATEPNSTTATLNVNGIGAKLLVKATGNVGMSSLSGGEIQTNGIYIAQYSTVLNSGAGAWLILNPTPLVASSFQAGMSSIYWGSIAPTGWLLCYGQPVSRTTFAALFSAIGTAFGAGDGSTTFNIPDTRGRVIGGADNMGGIAANRLTAASGWAFGATLSAATGFETHTLNANQMPTHTHAINDPGHAHSFVRPQLAGGTGRGPNPANFDVQLIENATTGTALTGISIQSTGSGLAHNNVQPTIIGNYIIKY